MRNDVVQLAVMALALVLGAAAEELLPNFLGVGFPVLLMAAQYEASRRKGVLPALLFAVAAGAMEDAISSLPYLTSIGYFVLSAVAMRWARLPEAAMALVYPVFQIWLYLWLPLEGGIFSRLLLSIPIGLLTGLAVWAALGWAERRAAVDEQG